MELVDKQCNRRRLLSGVAIALGVGLAGCTSPGESEGDDGDSEDSAGDDTGGSGGEDGDGGGGGYSSENEQLNMHKE